MKFAGICLVALASLRASHAFTTPPSPAIKQQQQQHSGSSVWAPNNKRDLVVVFMDDEDFDEEDFVDDGTGPSVTASAFQSSSGRLGEHPVIVVEPIVTKRDEPIMNVEAEAVESSLVTEEDPSKMRVKEIKAELDLWGVNYDDCFEKYELIKRLEDARKSPQQQIGQQLRVEMSAAGRKEKDQLRSFGYVGLTEEEFFEQQSAQARSKSGQRGRVEQTPVNQATSSTTSVSGRRQGGSIWLEETPAPQKPKKQPQSQQSSNHAYYQSAPPSIQLEDTPAPHKKKNRPSNTYAPQPQGITLESAPPGARATSGQRQNTILLEDLPGPEELPFASKRKRQPVEIMGNPAAWCEPQPPKIKVPTADVKGYVGLTEDEYFAHHAAAMNSENQRVAQVPPKTRVPFGMTEEEFLTQQKNMGIVNPSFGAPAPAQQQQQRTNTQGGIRGMSEQEYWNSRDGKGVHSSSGLGGGMGPDQLL